MREAKNCKLNLLIIWRWHTGIAVILLLILSVFLTGCGAPNLSAGQSNSLVSNLNSPLQNNRFTGSGYGPNRSEPGRMAGSGGQPSSWFMKGAYPMQEASFTLPDLKGNPFDPSVNDVMARISGPNGVEIKIPAFYDGNTTWRVRFTPPVAGNYRLSLTLNNKPIHPTDLKPSEFHVTGERNPGFIRIDPNHPTRFEYDNGTTYYPVGNNLCWKVGNETDAAFYQRMLGEMSKAGENWARIWMTAWDGKALDWSRSEKLPIGDLNLKAARRWDQIVETAQKEGIYLQMTIQYHGQFSTQTNPNWNQNPWNKANGGFLTTAEGFFTDPRAIQLEKAKLRYIVARWGYSPNVMAWELFNEVQWTDAASHGHWNEVTAWHQEMADYLRKIDPYHHLITSSSTPPDNALIPALDYLQPHIYTDSIIAATSAISPSKYKKPIFIGECGPSADLSADTGAFLHEAIWSSLFSPSSGLAEYWAWDNIEHRNLFSQYTALTGFINASGCISKTDLKVETGITLSNYAPALQCMVKQDKNYAAFWIRNRNPKRPADGKLTLTGMGSGQYELTWWNTSIGQAISHTKVTAEKGKPFTIEVPAVNKDVAGWIRYAGG